MSVPGSPLLPGVCVSGVPVIPLGVLLCGSLSAAVAPSSPLPCQAGPVAGSHRSARKGMPLPPVCDGNRSSIFTGDNVLYDS